MVFSKKWLRNHLLKLYVFFIFSRLMLTDVEDSLLSPPTKRISLDPPSPIAYSVQSVIDHYLIIYLFIIHSL